MSRICGLFTGQSAPVGPWLGRMRAALGLPAGWTEHSLVQEEVALCTAGAAPVIGRHGPISCIVDGQVLGLPEGRDMATAVAMAVAQKGLRRALDGFFGEFALAVFDHDEACLWLVRDRIGVRPCYYVRTKECVAFASRPGVLLAVPGVSADPDPRFVALFAASHYRVIDNAPDRCAYAALNQLPAGCLARIDRDGLRVERWWRLEEAPDFTEEAPVLAARYRELLQTAVSQRLAAVSGRPAFTLSGGMDSSSVLSMAVRTTGRRQEAFTTVYEDATFDESEDVATILDAMVAAWHPVRVGMVDVFATVREMVAVHDEPPATATWLSHWLLCQEVARGGFTHLFGGLGGDELNAGEYEYFFFHFADLRAAGQEALLSREIEAWAHWHDHPVWHKDRQVALAALARLTDPARPGVCLPDLRRQNRYRAALRPEYFDLDGFFPVMEAPFHSCLKNRTWQDISREAAPCCLRAEDRQTRAVGLVNMDPFYDHRLVEFMFRVPGTLKIRDGVTKFLLREAMTGIMPEATRTRIKKTGWNAPAHVWFTGEQADRVREMVTSSGFKAASVYNVPEVLRLLEEHCAVVASGRPAENHMMFFWQLVSLELWLERASSPEVRHG